MEIFIEETPFTDDSDTCIDDQRFYHSGCQSSPMTFHRCPATNVKTLRCGCGLKLVLFPSLLAETEIHKTAIDCNPRPLNPGTFDCTESATVIVVAYGDAQGSA